MRSIALLTHGGVDPPGEGVHVPFLCALISRLAEFFAITVYTFGPPSDHAASLSLGRARVTRIPPSPLLPFRLYALWNAVALDHHRTAYDLVHGIWAIPAGVLAVAIGGKHKIPSAISLHGAETARLASISYGAMRREPERSMVRWACRRADLLFVLSNHQRHALTDCGVLRDDVVITPPGAEPSFLATEQRRPPDGAVHILHVANLTEVKDQSTLLRAFASISREREAFLRIVGADYMDGAIQRLAGSLGVGSRVKFTGYVPHEQMRSHYRWAHLILQTSHHEAGGVAVAEAAAARVVVCGTATGLLADLAETSAVAAPPGDAEGLSRAVLALLREPERFMRIQQCAWEWASRNTVDSAAALIADAYERTLSPAT
ncbi:MAG: glycosyltransferase [Bacteroidota bacterium]